MDLKLYSNGLIDRFHCAVSHPYKTLNNVRSSLLKYDKQSNIKRIRESKITWHICTPKSASSFFMGYIRRRLEVSHIKFNSFSAVPSHDNRYQTVCSYTVGSQLFFSPGKNTIHISSHLHAPCTLDFMEMISDNHTVICQTRSILDTIVSLIDYFDQGHSVNSFLMLAHEYWDSLSYLEKVNEIIEYYLPWHINFLQTWLLASNDMNVKFLMFDDIVSATDTCFDSIFTEIPYNKNKIDTKNIKAKFNKGVSGRGAELPNDAINRIEKKIIHLDRFNQSLIDYL